MAKTSERLPGAARNVARDVKGRFVADGTPIIRVCPHCGAQNALRIGPCSVCEFTVCEKCGNVQYIRGERRIVHDECLGKATDSFSMIKFVK